MHQNDRRVSLARRDIPVGIEQTVPFFRADEPEPMAFVKTNRPVRGRPGSYEQRFIGLTDEMRQQRTTDATALMG